MDPNHKKSHSLLSFRAKIIAAFSVFMITNIVFGATFYYLFHRLDSWNSHIKTMYTQVQTYTKLEDYTDNIQNIIEELATNPKVDRTHDIQENISGLRDAANEVMVLNEEEKKDVEQVKTATVTFIETTNAAIDTVKTKGVKARDILDTTFFPAQDKYSVLVRTNIARENKEFQAIYDGYMVEFTKTHPFSIALIIVMYIVTFFLTFFFATRVTQPIDKITEVIKKIKEGDLNARIPSEGFDEIGQLASGFNTMVENLQQSYAKMEQTVNQKTGELEEKVKSAELQNSTLEETKRAMLNLLEDARLSEEKVKVQAEELQKALSETERLAHIANQERNTYLLLISSIGEGVVVLDLDKKITIVNHVTEQIMGYTAEEMIGKSFFDLFAFLHRDKKPVEERFWDEAFSAKQAVVLPSDISVQTKDKTLIPVAEVVSPIVDKETQESKGVIITFRDVREERALEDARISFISVASHQLRTPLTSMRWFSEMLIGGDAGDISEEQRHFVERIYQGTDRMIALVNLLLQIARVEAGRVRIEPAPVDMKTTTSGVLLTLKTMLDQKKQTIEIHTDPDPFPTIPMDQEVIWQVVQNLISNAIRYSPENSTINVNIKKTDNYAEYTVEDHGIGIPKDQQNRIFEKFFRAENALKMVPEGSGLGMSLVKLLVEGWNGKIWFESEEGKGTTFHFTIPLSGMEAREGEVKLTV